MTRLCTCLVVALGTALAAGQVDPVVTDPPAIPGASPEDRGPEPHMDPVPESARRLGFIVPEGASIWVSLNLPQRIQPEEFDLYLDVLHASDAQRALFRDRHAVYLDEEWTFRQRAIQPLWNDAARSARRPLLYDHLRNDYLRFTLFERRDRGAERLREFDRALFDMFPPFLSEKQRRRLEHVRHLRRRTRSMQMTRGFYPGSASDVIRMALDTVGDDVIMSDRFATIVEVYDGRVTRLAERYAQHTFEMSTKLFAASLQHRAEAGEEVVVGANRELPTLATLEPEFTESVRLARAIANANRAAIRDIAAVDPDTGAALVRVYNETNFPDFYPNPYRIDPGALPRSDEREPRGTAGATTAALLEQHQTRQQGLPERMADAYSAWRGAYMIAESGQYDPAAWIRFQKTINDLERQRFREAAGTLEALRTLHQRPHLLDEQETIWERTVDRADRFERDPRRPWIRM